MGSDVADIIQDRDGVMIQQLRQLHFFPWEGKALAQARIGQPAEHSAQCSLGGTLNAMRRKNRARYVPDIRRRQPRLNEDQVLLLRIQKTVQTVKASIPNRTR